MAEALTATDRFPLEDADLCVQCGLCLPHCPTYRKTSDENESPRGRIALMRAMIRNQLPLTPRLETHLDRCLTCRNCEAACPAQVPYGRLIDEARAVVAANRRETWGRRVLWRWAVDGLLVRPARLLGLGRLLRGYQRSGLQAIVRGSGLLRLLGLAAVEAQLPVVPQLKHYATVYPAKEGAHGDVALFVGCIARIVDQPTIDASIRILNKMGYSVHVPSGQNCCGAIHQHAGDIPGARRLIAQNLKAFASTVDMPVITLSSGCGAMLNEYGQHMGGQHASEFGERVYDFGAYLEDHHTVLLEKISTYPDRVAVHEPCSLRNVMRSANKTHRLLTRISHTKVNTLSSNTMCCGAAGIYFLSHPAMSQRLRDDTLQAIQDSDCRTVVTSNVGCALHLAAGIANRHLDTEVIHPAILIDRVLRRAD
jgi:glycolate oxidase iron-sulfur subunit